MTEYFTKKKNNKNKLSFCGIKLFLNTFFSKKIIISYFYALQTRNDAFSCALPPKLYPSKNIIVTIYVREFSILPKHTF